MSDYEPEEGDYVRVTLDLKVTALHGDGSFYATDKSMDSLWISPDDCVSVEKIDPPRKVGWYLDSMAYLYYWSDLGWLDVDGDPVNVLDISDDLGTLHYLGNEWQPDGAE